MIQKPLNEIIKTDIDFLVEQATSEGRTLDYKLTLPGNSDKDKVSFLADISAFANAGGGDLIFGIKETNGIAKSAPGLAGIDEDKEICRIEEIAKRGIDPIIPNIHTISINGFSDGPIILMRIPKSFMAPHAVKQPNGDWIRFYTRSSRNNQILDVPQIRSAFLLSESLSERMQEFQRSRLAQIISGETPISLQKGPKFTIHILPFVAYDPTNQTDISQLAFQHCGELAYESRGQYLKRYNLNGVIVYLSDYCYIQIFRQGAIEIVYNAYLSDEGENRIHGLRAEEAVIRYSDEGIKFLEKIGMQPPIAIIISLHEANGFYLDKGGPYTRRPELEFTIDRDPLILPDIVLDNMRPDIAIALKPMLDVLWQSCGYQKSPNYDENGRHKSK